MIEKTRSAVAVPYYEFYAPSGFTLMGVIPRHEEILDRLKALKLNTANKTTNESSIAYENGMGFNPCNHTQVKFIENSNASPLCSVCWRRPATGMLYTSGYYGIRQPQLPPVITASSITEDMRKRAWQSMYPEINNGLSLLVTIFEFRDFSRLVYTARKMLAAIGGSLIGKLPSDRLLSEILLSWSFGVTPMISDFKGIAQDLINLNDTLDAFIREGRELQTYHYKEVINEGLVTNSAPTINYNRREDTSSSSVYNASARISYNYVKPPYLEALMRVGGIRLTPKFLWEITPWSFVIDWLVNISKFLDQFDRDPRVTVYIHDYCDSIKDTTSHIYYYDMGHVGPSAPFGGMTLHSVGGSLLAGKNTPALEWKRSSYIRVPGFPNTGYALPALDSMSNRELVLSGALLRTRVKY